MIGSKGYNAYQSDWSNTPKLDFATNKPVANYYGAGSDWYRLTNRDSIAAFIKDHKDFTVGIDYYALYNICQGMTPKELLPKMYYGLIEGKVYYFHVTLKGENMIWEQIK